MSEDNLFVETLGEGPPVVLLHSSGLSGRQFRRLGTSLAAQGYRAVLPDLTGHGRSPPWLQPRPFHFSQDVAWLDNFLATHGPAHLVGHSYGGLIALSSARKNPQVVRSLGLFEPVAFGVLPRETYPEAWAALDTVNAVWGDTPAQNEAWLASFVDFWGGAGAWSQQKEPLRAEFRRVGWVVKEGVLSLVADTTSLSAYANILAPARLYTGTESPLAAQGVAQRLGEFLPQGQVIQLSQAGHMAPLSQAERVNQHLLTGILAAEGKS